MTPPSPPSPPSFTRSPPRPPREEGWSTRPLSTGLLHPPRGTHYGGNEGKNTTIVRPLANQKTSPRPKSARNLSLPPLFSSSCSCSTPLRPSRYFENTLLPFRYPAQLSFLRPQSFDYLFRNRVIFRFQIEGLLGFPFFGRERERKSMDLFRRLAIKFSICYRGN